MMPLPATKKLKKALDELISLSLVIETKCLGTSGVIERERERVGKSKDEGE